MKKLIAYITAGFPDKNFSIDLALALKEAGADILELGIPFSDPVADGPIIEEANFKSLQNGFKMDWLFDISKEITKNIDTYWMGYFNSFYHKGVQNISVLAHDLGIKGFIIPDLPHEETLSYEQTFKINDISSVSFVAPTDNKERIKTVVKDAQGFIYLVAYTGITGSGVSEDLSEIIDYVRQESDTPLYIGFGVNEKTAKAKSQGVDGVIVGSAFVKVLLEESLSKNKKIQKIATIAKNIKESINS
ncbi:MAG: tryptophan synthase subunit alpha [Campylobacteraceae bacterium]|nr:tryptophan synthase subunit alpha [Campylobacteraceae bacterium]